MAIKISAYFGIMPLLLLEACSPSKLVPQDSWERFDNQTQISDCQAIDDVWILPVIAEKRPEAIGRLENVDSVKIHPDDTYFWMSIGNDRRAVSARNLLEEEISSLKNRRHRAYDLRLGSFSNADDERLLALEELRGSKIPDSVSPYLIRAVAKNEFTGGFYAYECSDGVHIVHGSLGRSTPPTLRLPVVVFLRQPPAAVFPVWAMAE